MRKAAEGSFHGEVAIGTRQGLFRVRPLDDSRLFPETGLYRQEEELNEFGSNEALLRQVSAFTGGRFNPSPDQIFFPFVHVLFARQASTLFAVETCMPRGLATIAAFLNRLPPHPNDYSTRPSELRGLPLVRLRQ